MGLTEMTLICLKYIQRMCHICCFVVATINFFLFQDAILKISRNEGIFSLWSGLAPTLVLAIPATVVYFVTYEQLRVRIKDWHHARTGVSAQPSWGPLLAGSTARAFSVTLVSPLELVRTKMQSKRLSYFGKYQISFWPSYCRGNSLSNLLAACLESVIM